MANNNENDATVREPDFNSPEGGQPSLIPAEPDFNSPEGGQDPLFDNAPLTDEQIAKEAAEHAEMLAALGNGEPPDHLIPDGEEPWPTKQDVIEAEETTLFLRKPPVRDSEGNFID